MNRKLLEAFEIVETARGIKGILDDLACFCNQCAADAKDCNDKESSTEYLDKAKIIRLTANAVK